MSEATMSSIVRKRLAKSRTVPDILRAVTEHVLDIMQNGGWWHERVRRFDRPLPWDINNGWCEEWAEFAVEAIGRGHVTWLCDLDAERFDVGAHCVFVLDGWLYDAEVPDGVDRVDDLPFAREGGNPRPAAEKNNV